MTTIKSLLDQLKSGIPLYHPAAVFDAASILAQRGEWALLRWCYATNVAKRECAYWLRKSEYRGMWDI